jgi:hypothetical protein
MAKLLMSKGVIPGFQSIFSFDAFLAALQKFPVGVGTYWRREMFYPSGEGLVLPAGAYDGGHQYMAVQYIEGRAWIGFDNSWGRWGLNGTGRFYMEAERFSALLAENGDAIVYTLPTAPAPVPEPIGDGADRVLKANLHDWSRRWGIFGNPEKRAYRAWEKAKGL